MLYTTLLCEYSCACTFSDTYVASVTQCQIFTILPQILHFHKNRNFSSIFATFKTNCLIPINFMAGACQEYSFSFLPVVSR